MDDKKEYPKGLQHFYINFLLTQPETFSRCRSILKSEYWEDTLKPAIRYILEFSDEYHSLPTPNQVVAETKINVQYEEGINSQLNDWFLKEIEGFCRHRAIESVMWEGAELIEAGKYATVESKLKDAMTISLQTDLGTSYYEDPKARIQAVLDRQDVVSTGWSALDSKLYGGFTKGTLNIFAGGSGSGKSLFLQNLALNWSTLGFDVIYFSLELSENLVSARLDSMVTGYSTKEIFKKIDDVDLRVRMTGKGKGRIMVKKLPEAGTTSNHLRSYLKEYEIQYGKKPDAILVDYLDLMYPNNAKINPSDMFVKDKFVSEELRALASEGHYLFATASQLNRGSVEANGEFDHSHIAGGISKINTADNVFGIYATMAMKERGEMQLQLLKTRSSSAVGQRVELAFDQNSLRIADPDPDADITETRGVAQLTSDIRSKIAPKTAIKAPVAQNDNNQTAPAPAKTPSASPVRANMLDVMAKIKGGSVR